MKIGLRSTLKLISLVFLTCAPALSQESTPPSANQKPTTPTLTIIHFDVGTGDATLIVYEFNRTKDGKSENVSKTVLIDGGSPAMAQKIVIPGIASTHMATSKDGPLVLDYAVATHNDREHRDGLQTVLGNFKVSDSAAIYQRKESKSPINAQTPQGKSISSSDLEPGSILELKDPDSSAPPVVIKCVADNGATPHWQWSLPTIQLDENARSLAFLITFQKFSYFIGGDLTGGGRSGWSMTPDIESAVAREVGQVNVLRVNHHGSDTSSNQGFLSVLNPSVAIISTGKTPLNDRIFHWPSRSVLDRLNKLPRLAAVYITGEAGTSGGLTEEDKKKIKNAQGTIKITTTGDGTFQVNQTLFPKETVNGQR